MNQTLISVIAVLALAACGDSDDSTTSASGGSGASSSTSNSGGAGGTTNNGSGGNDASGGSSASGGATGAGGNNCAALSDELDSADALDCFTLNHQVEGGAAQYELLDIATTVAGNLVIEPTGSGWFSNDDAPFVFKSIVGDFLVETYVEALDETDGVSAPTGDYHSAGLVARDPASIGGQENWLMYNLGYQADYVGTERKTTVNGSSTLFLAPGGHRGRLRMCRVGNTYRVLRRLEGETSWTQEDEFVRDDLPATLQVGMVANAWPPGGAARNMQARFDYFRVGSINGLSGCDAPLSPM